MDIVRISTRRVGRVFAALGIITASVIPALVPAMVSADTVTSRSIDISSSAASATGVTYHVQFTSPSSTKDFVLDFCTTAPIGAACTGPTGFTLAGVGTSTSGYSVVDGDANTATVTLTSAGTAVDVELTGVANPTITGAFYARITTYSGTSDYTDAEDLGSVQDQGGVALNATDSFSVNGAVAETLTFCASGGVSNPITSGCGGTLTAPNLSLKGASGALEATLSEGTVYTQISTNALHGAVVSLKNSAVGGGLIRPGAATSDITPKTSAGAIADGAGNFGLKLANLGSGVSPSGSYATSTYFMDYASNGQSGVTSPYGSPVYNVTGPVNSAGADLTFGANISPTTPAGNYSATLGLIATGTF